METSSGPFFSRVGMPTFVSPRDGERSLLLEDGSYVRKYVCRFTARSAKTTVGVQAARSGGRSEASPRRVENARTAK